jgi:hypothetical protein
MAELGLPTSEVMQEHLQNLMSQGYMTAVELATCHVPEDPASLVPVGGGVRRGVHGVLRAGICCAITPISPLVVAVLWLGTSALDPLEDFAYGGLCDLVRDLYGD